MLDGLGDKVTTALPAMQVATVVISYLVEIIERLLKTLTFATGIEKIY